MPLKDGNGKTAARSGSVNTVPIERVVRCPCDMVFHCVDCSDDVETWSDGRRKMWQMQR